MEPNIWPSQRLGTAQHALHGNSWQLKAGRVERDWDEGFSCRDGGESDWSQRKPRVSIEDFLVTGKVQTDGRFCQTWLRNGCLSAGTGHYWRGSALLCSSHVKQDEVSCQVAIVNCSGSICSDLDVLSNAIYYHFDSFRTIFHSDCFMAFYILVLCLGKTMLSPVTPSWGRQAWSNRKNHFRVGFWRLERSLPRGQRSPASPGRFEIAEFLMDTWNCLWEEQEKEQSAKNPKPSFLSMVVQTPADWSSWKSVFFCFPCLSTSSSSPKQYCIFLHLAWSASFIELWRPKEEHSIVMHIPILKPCNSQCLSGLFIFQVEDVCGQGFADDLFGSPFTELSSFRCDCAQLATSRVHPDASCSEGALCTFRNRNWIQSNRT